MRSGSRARTHVLGRAADPDFAGHLDDTVTIDG
jgi:hypothetical protein